MAGGLQPLAKAAAQKLTPASWRTGKGGMAAASPLEAAASLGKADPASGRLELPIEPDPASLPPELGVDPGTPVLLPPEPPAGPEEAPADPPESLARPPLMLLFAACPPRAAPPDPEAPAESEALETGFESWPVSPPVPEAWSSDPCPQPLARPTKQRAARMKEA